MEDIKIENDSENELESDSELESNSEQERDSDSEPKFKIGDRVKTNGHGNIGTIYKVYDTCPQSNKWLSNQSIPVKPEAINRPWYSIECELSGAVVVPEYDVEMCYWKDFKCHYCKYIYSNKDSNKIECPTCEKSLCEFCDSNNEYKNDVKCCYCEMIGERNAAINTIDKLHRSSMLQMLEHNLNPNYGVNVDIFVHIAFTKDSDS